MTIAEKVRDWIPPALFRWVRHWIDYIRVAPWKYLPDGWPAEARGWDVDAIAKVQIERWPAYLAAIQGTAPLGVNLERAEQRTERVGLWDIFDHNNIVCFAYALTLASRVKNGVSVLDWGGGVGHYYPLSKALIPGLAIDYVCHDVPALCRAGRQLNPEVTFEEDPGACVQRSYDLVFAGSSLWCHRNWPEVLGKLAHCADPYVMVSRMVFIDHGASFVALQRPRAMGYDTEYPLWIINRNEFLAAARTHGLRLLREFLISYGPHIHRAPAQGNYLGFLFEKDTAPPQVRNVHGPSTD